MRTVFLLTWVSPGVDDETWAAKIMHSREQKDQFFRDSPDSPLPEEARAGFTGLPYFAPDPRYRFVLDLEEADDPETLEVPRTGGDNVTYTRVGTFSFAAPDGEGALAAYRTEADGADLFLMFRDATSGKETYGAGRYLDAKRLRSGRWYVDFNRAYHPSCVHNEAYTCPLPPPENWLTVPIPAGERL